MDDINSIEFADHLDELQKNENDGRGVSCVQSIVACLRRGEISDAKAILKNEGDKINQYPRIKAYLENLEFIKYDSRMIF